MKPQYRITILVFLFSLLGILMSSTTAMARDAQQRVTFAQPILVVNTSFLNVRVGPGVNFEVLVTVVGGTELPVLGVASDGVWYQVATDGGPGWVNVTYTLARGDFTNVPLVQPGEVVILTDSVGAVSVTGVPITGVSLVGKDMFAEPSYEAVKVSSSVPNDPGVVYPLRDRRTVDGTIWYLVDAPGIGTGWMDDIQLRFLDCGPENVGVIVTQTPVRFDGISTQDSYLVDPQTEILILGFGGVNNVWYRVQFLDGTIGLVDVEAVQSRPSDVRSICGNLPLVSSTTETTVTSPAPISVTGNRVVVNTGFLNVRTGPSAGFDTIATVPGGTELAVVGRAPDDIWLLVEGAFGRGWLNNQFVLFRGNYSSVPVFQNALIIADPPPVIIATPPPTGPNLPVTGNRVVVNTGFLNIRSGPSAGFGVVATVPGGTELAVVGRAQDGVWFYIEGTFGRGWLNNQFVLFRGDYSTVPVIEFGS